jgi:hypothetical protein
MTAGVVVLGQIVRSEFVRRLVDGVFGVGHAVPTHTGTGRLSVDSSLHLC